MSRGYSEVNWRPTFQAVIPSFHVPNANLHVESSCNAVASFTAKGVGVERVMVEVDETRSYDQSMRIDDFPARSTSPR